MQNWLSKISGSIKGILIGLILFVVSIGVLFWNEGRIDLSTIADDAVEINSTEQTTEAQDQLVYTSGKLTTEQQIGDTFLQPGKYIAINRNVDMYAWHESSQSKSETTNGDSFTDVDENTGSDEGKNYTYEKIWTSSPQDSSSFKFPNQHQNPKKPIQNKVVKADNAKISIYEIDTKSVQLPGFKDITLTAENAILQGGELVEDEEFGTAFFENFTDITPTLESTQYIFKGFGTLDAPEIGDTRISYTVVNADQDATIFGQLNGNKISSHIGEKNTKLYRIFSGTRDEAISTMTTEHTTSTWGLRILGFVLMWVGLGMLLGPISAVLDFVPLVGSLSKSVIGIVTFIVAAVLSTIVIWISMIMHNIIALIVVVVGIVAVILMILKQKSQKTSSPPPQR